MQRSANERQLPQQAARQITNLPARGDRAARDAVHGPGGQGEMSAEDQKLLQHELVRGADLLHKRNYLLDTSECQLPDICQLY